MKLNQDFWTGRYLSGLTGWDIGSVSTPVKEYVDQLKEKSQKILIPGGGNAYEAEYLFNSGFSNVYVLDISEIPLKNLLQRVPLFPQEHLIQEDFFEFTGKFDLILEQTFFCAIHPSKREAYVQKAADLLKPSGKLVGVLFNIPLNQDHPPFGGHEEEYRRIFKNRFEIEIMETAYNSIPPRAGNELFIKMKKK